MTLEPLLTQEDVDRKQRFLTREGRAARPLRWNDAGYWVCQDGDSDCVFAAYPDGSNYYGHRQYDLISRIPEPASEAMNKTDRCRTCGHEYDEHGYMDENDEGEFENPACHHFFLDGHRACGCKQFIHPEPAMESQVVDGCCPKHGSTWVTDGVCRLCKIHGDLDMEAQVVVEDRRNDIPDEASLHSFASFDSCQILRPGLGELYLKVGDGQVLQLTGANRGSAHHMNAATKCRHMPHLRLRLVLEERT